MSTLEPGALRTIPVETVRKLKRGGYKTVESVAAAHAEKIAEHTDLHMRTIIRLMRARKGEEIYEPGTDKLAF